MVVCKCRKATRQYCFVHKVGVCGECVCFPEHQICVVNKYSDWVINGEYDWPPKCVSCNSELEEGKSDTTRLGCLHVMHTKCLVSHIQNFPPQTAPAGYICPSCSIPIWPPTSIKDTGSALHSKLKEAIIQTGLEKNIFGNHVLPGPKPETRGPPPAFASDPLSQVSGSEERDSSNNNFRGSVILNPEPEIVEVDEGNNNKPGYVKSTSPLGPSAVTRKGPQFDRQTSEMSYYADDEDGNSKKYVKRGSFRHKFMRMLLPFWSSALPILPVTAPPRKEKDGSDASEMRARHNKSSKMDPRKILLFIALLACMATMGILYYRLTQPSFGDDLVEEEAQ